MLEFGLVLLKGNMAEVGSGASEEYVSKAIVLLEVGPPLVEDPLVPRLVLERGEKMLVDD